VRGLDTNVLVRYFTADDLEQAEIARATIDDAEKGGQRLFVSGIVLCELAWVLRGRSYAYQKSEIAETLDDLLETSVFEIEARGLVRTALSRYRDSQADFADCLLGLTHQDAGCSETWTFDTGLGKTEGFALLGP
jgi:predicted nucleic-acid-binding protein